MRLRGSYKPRHEENRMKHEGDVALCRKLYYEEQNKNLTFLLYHRNAWMNNYIDPNKDVGIEVGCGIGASKDFIKAKSYWLTDYIDYEWLDVKNVDASNTPFEDNSFDFVVSSNMIHHLPHTVRFFEEMHRILRSGGLLLIQEANSSLSNQMIQHIMRHEGYSFDVDVFDRSVPVCGPNDLWSGNTAIPNLLFDDIERFKIEIPYFEVVKTSFSEFLTFLNSGGVTAKTFYIPLPHFALKLLKMIDAILTSVFPQIFALQRQIVLQKR